jgi:hypothetical protein
MADSFSIYTPYRIPSEVVHPDTGKNVPVPGGGQFASRKKVMSVVSEALNGAGAEMYGTAVQRPLLAERAWDSGIEATIAKLTDRVAARAESFAPKGTGVLAMSVQTSVRKLKSGTFVGVVDFPEHMKDRASWVIFGTGIHSVHPAAPRTPIRHKNLGRGPMDGFDLFSRVAELRAEAMPARLRVPARKGFTTMISGFNFPLEVAGQQPNNFMKAAWESVNVGPEADLVIRQEFKQIVVGLKAA